MSFYKLTQGLVLEQDQLTSAADFTEICCAFHVGKLKNFSTTSEESVFLSAVDPCVTKHCSGCMNGCILIPRSNSRPAPILYDQSLL